jgi:hypothetical protein
MAVSTQLFTAGSTGDKTFVIFGLGFTPKALRFKVLKPGYADSTIPFVSGGYTDGTHNEGFSIIDNSGITAYVDNTKCLLAYDIVSGVNTKVLEATFVSFGSERFKLNFTAASAVYQVQVDLLS